MNKKVLSLFLPLICLNQAYATQEPIAYPSDDRIKMVAYQENNVVPIYGKTFTSTEVIFAKGEQVLNVDGGDTAGWVVTNPETVPNVLFIKPTALNSDSNITVITNKRNYNFHVMSNKTLNSQSYRPTYALKFTYPLDERRKLNAKLKRKGRLKQSVLNVKKSPENYNWQYSFAGNHQIMPLHVFDDGTFTFFELRPNQAVPAIFAVDDSTGKEAVVNIRRQGNYLVVQRLAPQFTLRNGKNSVASVFNKREITRIQHRG